MDGRVWANSDDNIREGPRVVATTRKTEEEEKIGAMRAKKERYTDNLTHTHKSEIIIINKHKRNTQKKHVNGFSRHCRRGRRRRSAAGASF